MPPPQCLWRYGRLVIARATEHVVCVLIYRVAVCQEVHAAAIRSLAELTARSIELFHKLSELILFSSGGADAGVLSQ